MLYLLTSILGYEAWKFHLVGGIEPGPILELCLYAGSLGLALPVALRNTYRSYRDGTGKMRPFLEAVRPLVSFMIAMALFVFWGAKSPTDILIKDPRLFFYASGTLCANLSCRLIVSQMSNTRCELINGLLWPLALAVAVSTLIPGVPELTVLYLLSALLTVFHVHYGICVVGEMSWHLHITPFSIKNNYGHQRLISNAASGDEQSDDDLTLDANDLEVIVSSNGLTGVAAGKTPAAVLQV